MSSRPTRKGGPGTIAGVHDFVNNPEEVQKSTSPQKTTKKFAKYGSGKSIAKHGKQTVEAEEEAEDPQSRPRARSQTRQGKKKAASSKERRGQTPPAANLRRSPRKKLIEDEPRSQDTLDPFPPPRPPMLVTDKPALINQFGEKVPAPVDADQRLRQAINFLSDEGPENCHDFEEKLDRLEQELRKDHPNWEGITPGGKNNDVEMLARKVEWMIWVHRNRLREGGEEWFVAHRFPTSAYKKPIPGSERWQALNKGIFLGAPKFPKLQVLLLKEQEERKKAKEVGQAAAVQGTQRSSVPKPAPVKPWDEPLPRPEVWHRHEAPRFPFGETPNMEMMMSKQISDDLAKGEKGKETGWTIPFFKFTWDWRKGKPEEWPIKKTTPWALPEVTQAQVQEAFGGYSIPLPGETKKRKATTDGTTNTAKRTKTGRV